MAEDFNPGVNPAPNNDPTNNTVDPATTSDQASPDEETQELLAPKKPKTNAELQEENKKLRIEIERLTELVNTLKAKLPNHITARPGYKVVFIKSNQVATIPKNGKKYLEGSVNGEKFEVLCDTQVEVTDAIAEALAGVISAQAK